MKKNFTFFFLLFLSTVVNAQVENLKLGYQEFPTNLTGQTSDEAGNLYYSGHFKGQLKIKDSVLQTGAGLEDIFLVKTDITGKTIYSKSFGTANPETPVVDGLTSSNNEIYLATRIGATMSFGNIYVSPYQTLTNGPQTNAIVKFDTSGKVIWANRTSLALQKVYATQNIIHAIGVAISTGEPVKFNDTELYPANSVYMVHLMLDTAGNLINHKALKSSVPGNGSQIPQFFSTFSDGKICMVLRVIDNNSYFHFGKQTISLPTPVSNYTVLIKTDTSYSNISLKVLNSDRVNLFSTNGNNLPICVSKQDSVYLVATSDNSATIAYDGINIPYFRKNVMVVFDSSLKTKRVVDLGSSNLANAAGFKRRVFFRSVNATQTGLYITGAYLGTNESPINLIPTKDSSVFILPSLKSTVDLNGPSKSFVVKTTFDLKNNLFNWIGEHTEYETPNIYTSFSNIVKDSLLIFSFTIDNIFNPRIADANAKLVLGSMTRNADLPDVPKLVEYLPDGSRIIVGLAKGKTVLDSANADVKSTASRTDVFVTRITSKGEVKWYKRFYSTLPFAEARRLLIRNSKAYFLINYFSSLNDSNYIRVDGKTYDVKTSASLMASIDTSGAIEVINLEKREIKYMYLNDFNFCSNGDLAILTGALNNDFIAYPSFPGSFGFCMYRLNTTSNSIVARRNLILTANVVPFHIDIDRNDIIYLSIPMNGSSQVRYGVVKMHDGNSFIDSITVENNVIGEDAGNLAILKMSWNKFNWFKKSKGQNNFGLSTTYPAASIINNKLIVIGRSTIINPATGTGNSFYWDNKPVFSTMDPSKLYMFTLDTAGKIESYKIAERINISYAKKRENGTLILSGTITNPITIDTISLAFDGGGNDAVSIVLDSNLTAKRAFRLATPYSEAMFDMDIYKDSIITFAYTAQTVPTLKTNRTAISVGDYAEDAFLASQVLERFSVLPIQLISFAATRNENIVNLNWTVAQNGNGNQYVIQRSQNGSSFIDIGVRKPENVSIVNYSATDALKQYGKYYYRLQITSADGKVTYSKTSQILYPASGSSFYYDNSNEQLYILRGNSNVYQYSIFDGSGRRIMAGQKTTGNKTVSLEHLSKGQYIIRTQDNNLNYQAYQFIK